MSLFDGIDPAELQQLTERIGTRVKAAVEPLLAELAEDDSVNAHLMVAALVNCHLLGAASALASGLNQPTVLGAFNPQYVVMEAMATMANRVSEIRGVNR